MTESGISKKVFFGVMLATAITEIAKSDDKPENKLIYVYVLASLLVIYLLIQAFMDYTNRARQINNEPDNDTH